MCAAITTGCHGDRHWCRGTAAEDVTGSVQREEQRVWPPVREVQPDVPGSASPPRTSAVSWVTVAEAGVTVFFPSSLGLAEQTDSHRGVQWNNSHLWGGVWNPGALQQGIYRHVPHIRQQCRQRQVGIPKAGVLTGLHSLQTSLTCGLPASS